MLLQLGRPEEAARALGEEFRQHAQAAAEKLVQLEPSAVHYYLLAVARQADGNLPGARAAIERAYALNPGDDRIRRACQQLQGRSSRLFDPEKP